MWEIPRIWEDGQCIIIGGGASVPKQFNVPDEIIKEVYAKRLGVDAYSPYMSAIHDQHIIAVNMAYRLGPWVDCVYFGDNGFLKDQQIEFFAFKGLRITSGSSIEEGYSGRLKIIERDMIKKRGISWRPNHICWNGNSGAGAINLAVNFGVKRIILLGFDMKLDDNNNQHWHKFYKGNLKTVHTTFNLHLKGFPEIAKDLEGKVEVYNMSMDSVIEDFPKITLKDAIERGLL